jgi:hypothetical protein
MAQSRLETDTLDGRLSAALLLGASFIDDNGAFRLPPWTLSWGVSTPFIKAGRLSFSPRFSLLSDPLGADPLKLLSRPSLAPRLALGSLGSSLQAEAGSFAPDTAISAALGAESEAIEYFTGTTPAQPKDVAWAFWLGAGNKENYPWFNLTSHVSMSKRIGQWEPITMDLAHDAIFKPFGTGYISRELWLDPGRRAENGETPLLMGRGDLNLSGSMGAFDTSIFYALSEYLAPTFLWGGALSFQLWIFSASLGACVPLAPACAISDFPSENGEVSGRASWASGGVRDSLSGDIALTLDWLKLEAAYARFEGNPDSLEDEGDSLACPAREEIRTQGRLKLRSWMLLASRCVRAVYESSGTVSTEAKTRLRLCYCGKVFRPWAEYQYKRKGLFFWAEEYPLNYFMPFAGEASGDSYAVSLGADIDIGLVGLRLNLAYRNRASPSQKAEASLWDGLDYGCSASLDLLAGKLRLECGLAQGPTLNAALSFWL